MKISVINGSPRGRKSVSALMCEEFLKGAALCGATGEQHFLSEMKIHHCIECFHCWKNQGRCVFDDDMKKIMPFDCDLLVLATPLFVDNVTGLMKTFLDRMVAYANPAMSPDSNGETRHPKKTGFKLMAISNCGFPEQSHFEVLRLLFRRMARNMNTELIGEIYRGEGPLLGINDTDLLRIQQNYKALLKQAGKEIAQNLCISKTTQEQLELPLIPYEEYIQAYNRWLC